MKILQIAGYFLLPDDFNGTNEDALDLLVEYRKNKGYTGNKTGQIRPDATFDNMWETFIYCVENTEFKWTGDINTQTLTDNGWVMTEREEIFKEDL